MFLSITLFSALYSLLSITRVGAVAISARTPGSTDPNRAFVTIGTDFGSGLVDFTVIGLDVVQDFLHFSAQVDTTGNVVFALAPEAMGDTRLRVGTTVNPLADGPGVFYANLGPNRDLVMCHLVALRNHDINHAATFTFQEAGKSHGSYLYPCFGQPGQDWVQVNCGGGDNANTFAGATCDNAEWTRLTRVLS